jgi:hypothetical protein
MSRFSELTRRYENTSQGNDAVYAELTALTDSTPVLKKHRDWVEANRWGFGDRAFHALWHLLLEELSESGRPLSLLEIGVFKGQVCSLWLVLSRELGADVRVTGVSPLRGSGAWASNLGRRVLQRLAMLSARFEKKLPDIYQNEDYAAAIRHICDTFACDPTRLQLVAGYSTDERVKRQVAGRRFDLVYIDGGHEYETVKHDIAVYGKLVPGGGYLVLDDASLSLPGDSFWKGHPGPSQAADEIPPSEFVNVLNVGHNRVFRKL